MQDEMIPVGEVVEADRRAPSPQQALAVAKLRAALVAHPLAVSTLIEEAIDALTTGAAP